MSYSNTNKSIEEQLAELNAELEQTKTDTASLDTEVKDKQKELDASKGKEKALTDRIAALTQTSGDIDRVKEQVKTLSGSVAIDLTDATDSCQRISSGLAKQLSQDYLNKVAEVRTTVDTAIADAKKELGDKRAEVKTKEGETDTARRESREADVRLADAKTMLNQLPVEIQAARAEVLQVKAAMESAYHKDLLTEAYLKALDLEQELADTIQLIAPDMLVSRIDNVEAYWQAAKAAKDKLQTAIAGLDALKADLVLREKAYADLAAKRKANIDKQVNELDETARATTARAGASSRP
ncbi:MAG: hypothetical protein EHM21_06440 [Chloroflexi bacterium]|nr:MAG: hypothetical protein EHM21_06440 [Chloroflexota bacterium]